MPDVTFGAVSLQLRALSAAGLVRSRAEGRIASTAQRDALGPMAKMSEQRDDALWRSSSSWNSNTHAAARAPGGELGNRKK